MDGWFSDEDNEAVKKVFKIPNMDPQFDELDQKVRDQITEAYVNSPEVEKIRKDWSTMDEDKKKEAVKYPDRDSLRQGRLERRAARFRLRERVPRRRRGSYGSYSKFWDEMEVNLHDDFHGDPNELLDTIAHEIGHKYQNQLIDKLDDGKLKPGDPEYEQARAFKLADKYKRKASSDDWDEVYKSPRRRRLIPAPWARSSRRL